MQALKWARQQCRPPCRAVELQKDSAQASFPLSFVPFFSLSLSQPMTSKFGLVVVGDEILSGNRVDKHLGKGIELLAARGLALSYAD